MPNEDRNDHALVARCVSVTMADGQTVDGVATVDAAQRTWSFTPARPWTSSPHQLVVRAVLEDLAGNSVARVFDRELADGTHDPIDVDRISVAFAPVQRPS